MGQEPFADLDRTGTNVGCTQNSGAQWGHTGMLETPLGEAGCSHRTEVSQEVWASWAHGQPLKSQV